MSVSLLSSTSPAAAATPAQPTQPPLLPDELPEALAFVQAAAQRADEGHYDELHGQVASAAAAGAPRPEVSPLWQRFFQANGSAGWVDLANRSARVRRRVADDGATYNVYDDGVGTTRAWPLELLPLLIAPDEWAGIERGVLQRTRLLNAAMADIYGERRLLEEGVLPPSLVLGHPQYLRPLHGCVPPGGVHLHVVAFDLARQPDGAWWVLGQRTQAPSGQGYMLENRLIISQQFPEAFGELRAQRLAASFQTMLQGVMRLSPAGERSRVVLLTPGPHNETYFEHVFLARYLGITLVEGGDLTVRANRVYLKTLHGMERVHGILRRVDDEFLDPLELRSDSALGVPGLLQALRAGEVVVANTPGAGWLESPGLAAFWPGACEALLGEELLMPTTTTWWCGEESVWRTHQSRLEEYVVAATFPASDTTTGFAPIAAATQAPSARASLTGRIEADPAAYTLLARAKPSQLPVWRDGLLEPRTGVLRVFAVSDGRGSWQVMPGGLTRVATRRDGIHDPLLSMQRGSASIDTWVLTDGAVDATTLLPPPLSAADLVGWHRTVTSRSAENLFWLGRYTERAENLVRLVKLTLESLSGSMLYGASPAVLQVLDLLARRHGLVAAGVPSPTQSLRVFERSLVHAMAETRGVTSIAFNLQALQSSALALRERLSQEHWKLINEIGERFQQQMTAVFEAGSAEPLSDVLGVLASTATQLAAITGAQTDRMTRDDGWRLLSVGRHVERLDFLSHALATGFEHGLHRRDDGFALMLGLFDSTITYRAQFQARREVPPLLHLLVWDSDNPRSLGWVARTLRDRFRKLARSEADWAEEVSAPLPQPGEWPLEAFSTPDATGGHAELVKALRHCSEQSLALSDAISRHLFAHVENVDRLVWQ